MKLTMNSRLSHPLTILATALTLTAAANAQQASATSSPPVASEAAASAAAAMPQGQSSATPVATGDASTAPAPAAVPAQVQAASTPPVLPPTTATASADLAPLPPVVNFVPEKKKKGKVKGKKARKRQAPGDNEDAGMNWGDPWGDSQDELRAAGLSFRFLIQTHYRETIAASSQNPDVSYRLPEDTLVHKNDGWDVNRLFFRIAAEPGKYLGYKLLLDFAEFKHGNPKQVIKQAFAELRPVPKHVHFLVGVLKLPYSITELDPIATYEFTKMGEANDLVKGMGFAGRDIGAEIMVAPLSKSKHLNLALGLFRGHAYDEHSSLIGAIGARAESHPVKGFRLGVDWVRMPKTITYLNPFGTGGTTILPNPEDPNFPRSQTWVKGQAFSGDITFHRYRLMLRAEGMIGTRIDYDTQYGAKKFGAIWGIAAYRFPVGPVELQPALRAEWLDTDMEHSVGLRRQLTAGIATYIIKSTRVLLDVTRTDVQDNSPVVNQPLPLREFPYNALSNTCVTGQLQVVL